MICSGESDIVLSYKDRWLSPSTIARSYGVTDKCVRDYCKKHGGLKCIKFGKCYKIKRSWRDEFLMNPQIEII